MRKSKGEKTDMSEKRIEDYIRTIPDFPEKGVMFRDITTILEDPEGLKLTVDRLCDSVRDVDFDLVVGLESRGFIFGVPMAYALGKGFVPIRKKGKLPAATISKEYDLEYGKAEIEIHKDSVKPGQRVVLIDDLIATGGTMEAACSLVEELGGSIAKLCFVMELQGLKGRDKLKKYEVEALVTYPGN